MSNATINLTEKLYEYCLSIGVHEHPVLTELRCITAPLPGAQMQIAPDQGQFMSWLVSLMSARKTLDIGCFTGYSALVVALALPANGKVYSFDVDAKVTEIAKEYWDKAGVADKIQLQIGPAVDSLAALLQQNQHEQFDFAFIDADKGQYRRYYELSLQLLRPGGVIMVDNSLWGGAVADTNNTENGTVAIRDLNAFVSTDLRVEICLLVSGDGLLLAKKR